MGRVGQIIFGEAVAGPAFRNHGDESSASRALIPLTPYPSAARGEGRSRSPECMPSHDGTRAFSIPRPAFVSLPAFAIVPWFALQLFSSFRDPLTLPSPLVGEGQGVRGT